jgi:predicted acyltransferase
MFLMMAEVMRFGAVAKAFPDSPTWQWLAWHQSHAPWRGCSLHDLIQPSFSFLVGVALPFSLAARRRRGQSTWRMTLHAAVRAFILTCLGIFLRSIGKPQTYYTFEDTLTQIGLGYLPLFLLGLARPAWAWVAFAAILVGDWAAFALYPPPGAAFDFAAVGVPADWPHHLTGFAAHWDKNSNLGWAFDRWFLNLFPREKPFAFNDGGYATLSFVPTLATMALGLITGRWLQDESSPWRTCGRLVLAGAISLGLGWLLDATGVCPSVKRIWTPAWVLVSGGWCCLFLVFFHAVLDTGGWQGWAYPLRVIGINAIAAYCIAHLIDDFVISSFKTHLGQDAFRLLGPEYERLLRGVAILAVYWLILFWMDRRRIYIKV